METFTKKPLEVYPIAIDFAGKLPVSTDEENPIVIASGTFSAVNKHTGEDATAEFISDTAAVIFGEQALTSVQGGALGDDYLISCLVLLSPGSPVPTLHEDVTVYVRDTFG